MMGSAMIPAVIVCCLIPFYPESPRWYMTKERHGDAFKAICRLRHHRLQAARDLFYMHVGLQAEREALAVGSQSRWKEFFTIRRNRNALVASEIVMFMQQFCGVNVIAYYSSEIFLDANFTEISALSASLGFGIINFLFAIPAIYSELPPPHDCRHMGDSELTVLCSDRHVWTSQPPSDDIPPHGALPLLYRLQFLDP